MTGHSPATWAVPTKRSWFILADRPSPRSRWSGLIETEGVRQSLAQVNDLAAALSELEEVDAVVVDDVKSIDLLRRCLGISWGWSRSLSGAAGVTLLEPVKGGLPVRSPRRLVHSAQPGRCPRRPRQGSAARPRAANVSRRCR